MAESKNSKAKVAQLQLLQQNLQNLLMQKQQFQMQLNEIDSAMEEMKDAKQTYKIIGNIMVLGTKEELLKQLNQRRESLELRLKMIESQEEKIRKKAEELQAEVVSEMKKGGAE